MGPKYAVYKIKNASNLGKKVVNFANEVKWNSK